MRRLQRRYLPLIDRVIRNPVESHLTAAPRLFAGPGDAGLEVARLSRRKWIDVAGRASATSAINAHANVAVRHPFLRIDNFPILIKVRRTRPDVGMLAHHGFPGVG